MKKADQFLGRFVKYLWLVVGYLGINWILIASSQRLDPIVVFIFLVGVLKLVSAYWLFKKTPWAWKTTLLASVLSFIYLLIYLVPLWLVIYLTVSYMTWHFRHQLGAGSKSLRPRP